MTIVKLLCVCARVEQLNKFGCQMVGAGISLLKWGIIDKQGENDGVNSVNGFELETF